MNKRVHWIQLDERTDTRDVRGTATADVAAILGGPLQGWGDDTHTVMALDRDAGYQPAHAQLTAEEAASLPVYRTQQEFHNA